MNESNAVSYTHLDVYKRQMLQCFYARAMHSRNPKNKFRDTKAEELIDRIDYDFSNAKKDTAMLSLIHI